MTDTQTRTLLTAVFVVACASAAGRGVLRSGSEGLAAADETQASFDVRPNIPGGSQAVGDLLVAPTRVVFDGRQRSTELTLVNIGNQTATYRISFIQMRMTETGHIKEIDSPAPGEQFADGLIRFSPRQVVLEPHVAQTVRMEVRKPADLAAGEYRSHLLFRAVPPADADSSNTAPVAPSGFSVALKAIYGVSIPVIVRHGETAASLTLSDLALSHAATPTDAPVLTLRMNRSGNTSVHGNFTVTFSSRDGRERVVGLLNGVAVYVPNPVRVLQSPLRSATGLPLSSGRLRVRFVNPKQKTAPSAEAELALP